MTDEKSLLSRRVKALREERGWSIAELARRTGVSVSMLWKVENAQTTLTYGKLVSLAAGLEAPIGELFAHPEPSVRAGGRRVVERSGSGPLVDVRSNNYRFLATEIVHKDYSPCVVEVTATGDGADTESHVGQEFAYVIAGRVQFICEGYAPVILELGDSVYFDATQGHRYLSVDGVPARILCVYSHPESHEHHQAAGATATSPPLKAANEAPASPVRRTTRRS